MSTIGPEQVMAVIPLRKPREKLWANRSSQRGKASLIKGVLAKFEEVGNRKSDSSLWHQKRVGNKGTDNRPTISCLKGGFARESPGT